MHSIGTQANVIVVWRSKANVRASGFVRALVGASLHAMSEHLEIHQPGELSIYRLYAHSVILVGNEDHRLLPVVPVHVVLEHRHCEWMRHSVVVCNDFLETLAVKVR